MSCSFQSGKTDGDCIRERGPLTVAAFMDHALYDSRRRLLRPRRPTIRARGRFFYQRRCRAGVRRAARNPARRNGPDPRAENRRARRAACLCGPCGLCGCVRSRRGWRRERSPVGRYSARGAPPRSSLFERTACIWSRRARAPATPQRETLGDVADRLASSDSGLPPTFEGRAGRQRAARCAAGAPGRHAGDGASRGVRGCRGPSPGDSRGSAVDPALAAYLERLGIVLETGWRAEINLRARRLDSRCSPAVCAAGSSS